MKHILIVDDEESVRYSFTKLLHEPDYKLDGAGDGQEALAMLQTLAPDLILLDIQMPGLSGLEVLQRIKQMVPRIPVLIMTAYGSSDRIIDAIKKGAYDYIEKPFDIPAMKSLIDQAIQAGHLMRTQVLLESPMAQQQSAADVIIGKSPAMREVYKMIGRIASSDVNILILGASGTGKELVARAIYQHSKRADKAFLAVNCAAIPETLLESELFGYERGAFTGASKRKIGKFQQADGGTIFLDEIGDMSASTQAKILRVLQEGTFEMLGGEETMQSNVRILAATNVDLERAIVEKKFREDLYYRLKVITIDLPPLRQRREDIPELCTYFLGKYLKELDKEPLSLSEEAMQVFMCYNWPGNIRELQNVLKRAMLLSKGHVITADAIMLHSKNEPLKPESMESHRLQSYLPADLESHRGKLYPSVMGEVERELILLILKKESGNQVRAAQFLGISRVMLHERMERYGITTNTVIEEM
jgi:DNA-binding NtrC family response regulator